MYFLANYLPIGLCAKFNVTSGIDRRCAKNGKDIIWIKYRDEKSKEKQHGMVVEI
jgi:hypothetical protein